MSSQLRSAGGLRAAVTALVVAACAAGYVGAAAAVHSDRKAAAQQSARLDSARLQVLLERAGAFVSGLADQLGAQPVAGQARFGYLAGAMSASVGLVDALWISNQRDRLTVDDATTIRPGASASTWPALANTIRSQQVLFGVTATPPARFEADRGFFVVSYGRFGQGAASAGYLAAFIPTGWIYLSLGNAPRQLEIRLNGGLLGGSALWSPADRIGFQAMSQSWQVAVPLPPATSLQTSLPWIALTWPIAIAVIALLVGSATAGRVRAERTVERIFEMSPDLLCVAGYDGFFKRVNPSFEETLGFPRDELLSKPFFDLVEPADIDATREAFAALRTGEPVVEFRNRYICQDGSGRWLEWNCRPDRREHLIYCAARDVTERHAAELEVRRAQAALEQSRDALKELADDQAALRRVATLVARGAPPQEVFSAVTIEALGLLRAQHAALLRYEPGSTVTVVASAAASEAVVPVDSQVLAEAHGVASQVRQSGRPTDIIGPESLPAPASGLPRVDGLRSTAGAPVTVEGELWGVLAFGWHEERPRLSHLEARMTDFTELAAIAIANAHSRSELAASRARVVLASDETRRRIERDLHDGTQQRLVALALTLRAAHGQIPETFGDLKRELLEMERGLAAALAELQEISRGIHPAILTKAGLEPALRALARRTALPIEVQIDLADRLPAAIEVAAYYLVSEAVTNAVKHAHASVVKVSIGLSGALVEIVVSDDGLGGADPDKGSGLVGLRDRIDALSGRFEISSQPGNGTKLRATIPVTGGAPADAQLSPRTVPAAVVTPPTGARSAGDKE